MEIKRYIITGGPGSGKSTLLEELQQSGYHCSAEVSRRMIIAEVAKGTDCLPWQDISCFSAKVITEMIALWHSSSVHSLTFFDRAMPDVVAYLKIAGLPVPAQYFDHIRQHAYQLQVFILPPWREIFVNDSERWQSFEEATAIYHAIRETYIDNGYQLTEVPKGTPAQRMAYILDFIK